MYILDLRLQKSQFYFLSFIFFIETRNKIFSKDLQSDYKFVDF